MATKGKKTTTKKLLNAGAFMVGSVESLFIILLVLQLLEFLQALNGSCSAFATRQDRKRHLSTFRTIQVATE
jgi:hypothetical protein